MSAHVQQRSGLYAAELRAQEAALLRPERSEGSSDAARLAALVSALETGPNLTTKSSVLPNCREGSP